jgi:hypothetical protein
LLNLGLGQGWVDDSVAKKPDEALSVIIKQKPNLGVRFLLKGQYLKWHTWQPRKDKKNGKKLGLEIGARFILSLLF